jgi:hypothetical protein
MTSTALANLVRIGQLDEVPPSPDLVARMLSAARQQLKDAAVVQLSNETRFDCAYNAIRAVADVALLLNGYRTSASKPGHHQTAIQTLEHTLAVDANTVRILDGLRRQRAGSVDEGEPVTNAALEECLRQAHALLRRLEITLTSGSVQRGDAVRAKLAESDVGRSDIASAVAWARGQVPAPTPAPASQSAAAGKAVAKPKKNPASKRAGKA